MISFLRLPKNISTEILTKDMLDYLAQANSRAFAPAMVELDRRITGLEGYYIYKGNKKIGFFYGFNQDGYWYNHRIFLKGKYRFYLRQFNDKLASSKRLEGYNGIITIADKELGETIVRHKIGRKV